MAPRKGRTTKGVPEVAGADDWATVARNIEESKRLAAEGSTGPLTPETELTYRDEANAIVCQTLRNGFLEDLHAGHWSPILTDPSYSRITDAEIKKLMIETSAGVARWLWSRDALLDESPEIYFAKVANVQRVYTSRWERTAQTWDLPDVAREATRQCNRCSVALQPEWLFCPMCGSGAPTR